MSDFWLTVLICTLLVVGGWGWYCAFWFRKRWQMALRGQRYLDARAENEPVPGAADMHALLTVAVQMGKYGYDSAVDLFRAKVMTEQQTVYGLEAYNRIRDTYAEAAELRALRDLVTEARRVTFTNDKPGEYPLEVWDDALPDTELDAHPLTWGATLDALDERGGRVTPEMIAHALKKMRERRDGDE